MFFFQNAAGGNESMERPEATTGTFQNNSNSDDIKSFKLKIVS